MSYTKSWQILYRKRLSMLIDLNLPLASKCVLYRPESLGTPEMKF